jgi:hypothetical protein
MTISRRGASNGRHDLQRVPEPITGYPMLPTSVHNQAADITPVAVVDVYDARRRMRALARVDLLDRQRRGGHIDEAALLAGREVEAMFEQMSRIGGGGQWLEGDRIDAATCAEMATVLGLERARRVNGYLGWLVRIVGKADARLLWIILGGRFSFALAAAAFQRRGVRGLRYTIDRFRDALAALADAKAAKGRAVR